jgi:hypothetical protein
MEWIILLVGVGVLIALWLKGCQLNFVASEATRLTNTLQEVLPRVETVAETALAAARVEHRADPALKRIATALELHVGALIHKEDPFPESSFGYGVGPRRRVAPLNEDETVVAMAARIDAHACPRCRRFQAKVRQEAKAPEAEE